MILHTKLHTMQSPYVLFSAKIDRYIRKYDKTRHLALFHSEIFNGIFI